MTSLSTHLFYSELNGRDDTSCERYFRYDVPSPGRSVESGRPLARNHIVGVSLTYEEDILHVIQMFESGGIPPLAAARGGNAPIVIMGGPAISANPEPYVDFADAFVIGEGDRVIHEIIDTTRQGESRTDVLNALGQIPGVYVPTLNQEFVTRLVINDLDGLNHPTAQIVPDVPQGSKYEPVFGRSLLVEVTRGCGHSCKFCLVGHICRPRRARSLARLKDIIKRGIEETPVRKVALIGSSLGDMDQLEELATWIVSQDLQLSVPSLRADSVTEGLLAALVIGGQRMLTIAPETGTERLRMDVGKGLTDADIERAVRLASESGIGLVKLYYIVGLPGENKDDIEGIVHLTRKLVRAHDVRITASVTPFVPKANTRYEREPQKTLKYLRGAARTIDAGLRGEPRVILEMLDPRSARVQAALSIGDRRLGKVMLRAASYGGLGGWRRAEKEAGIAFLSLGSDPSRDCGALPWSFIRHPRR